MCGVVDLPPIEHVRALMAAMREYGATRIHCGAIRIALAPLPAAQKANHSTKVSDADEDDAALEQSEEDRTRAAWDKHWSRMLRSSGASTPPYPGLEQARSLGFSS